MTEKKPSKADERRIQPRIPVELDVDLSSYGRYHLSRLSNVSIGGAFIVTRNLQPIGTELKVKFRLPGDPETIETAGTVVWVFDQSGSRGPNSSGMGIQFTTIAEKDRERIARFVDSARHQPD